ncbi:hypothetical protein NEOLEDRAFT_1129804 [Neolentinus lepideus HHB14362 ss-1]|uniref:Uncharacterized protein n=1 Tax=Neolentinus lepideus HHB14362 ss-1 TaxID=1314782 RepID=A0A165UME4_9AGAM|nr:hypothetical protein NEOLEDRAFT_1129804 [Neolentinus lepideus HHB14362 ss-1]
MAQILAEVWLSCSEYLRSGLYRALSSVCKQWFTVTLRISVRILTIFLRTREDVRMHTIILRRWQRLDGQPVTWLSVRLAPFKSSYQGTTEDMRRMAPHLKCLGLLGHCGSIEHIAPFVNIVSPHLCHLRLSSGYSHEKTGGLLADEPLFERITHLYIDDNPDYSMSILREDPQTLWRFPYLRYLHLSAPFPLQNIKKFMPRRLECLVLDVGTAILCHGVYLQRSARAF